MLAPEGLTGKSVVALGIVDALTREVGSVGVFRPVIAGGDKTDQILQALVSQPAVRESYAEAYGVTYDEVRADADEAMSTIVSRFATVAERYDSMVILGSDYTDVLGSTELTFNARIAANLNAPVALAVSARRRTPEQVCQLTRNTIAELTKHHAKTIVLVATRVPDGEADAYADALRGDFPDLVVGTLAAHRLLAAPTLGAQLDAVEARLVSGRPEQLAHESQSVFVAAMTLPNILARLEPESTLLVPGDRAELVPGILLAHTSGAFPQLTGLILVGGYEIPEPVRKLIDTVHHELPIAVTELGTYTTAEKLFNLEGTMTSSGRKTELCLLYTSRCV